MANQIDRDAFVKRDVLKNPIPYTRGTDLLPIVIHFRDFQIPSGATARVFVAKSDGNAVYTTATIDRNDVTVDVTDQMFIELGTALMQISIMDGEEELVSFVQPVDVQQNLKAGDLPASTTDVKFLDEAIKQANEAVNTATTAAQQAATAVQNANQAIEDANDAISDLNAQIASLNTNFASLANNVSISQLDTTAKTLVGAIDELNSKAYLLQGGTSIPSNSDLNDYTTPGNYYCSTDSTVETLENYPFTHAFTMKVEYSTGTGYSCQTVREFFTGKKAYRYYASDSEQWNAWKYFSDDANIGEFGTWTPTLSAGLTVTSGTGTYYKIGRFVFCNVIIWINSSQATDDDLYITLPFNSAYTRTYGTVGYINPFEDFDNLCVGIVNTDNKAYLIYAPGDDISNTKYIKGNQITTAIQFTICYIAI